MIDGSFPDYRRIYPAPCEPIAVNGNELRDAIKRVRIASGSKERKLRIKRNDKSLYIRIEGNSGFEGEEELTADCEEGFEIGVNSDLLSQMLAAIDSDGVAIENKDNASVLLFRPVSQSSDTTFTGLLMTMRI